MISVQKVGYSIFFIIKHHLNEFKFCLLVLLKRFTRFYQPKKTLLLRLG
ncbi:hypothetical protein HMPREF1400_00286 [Helicobacter pylori GAM119Bi]|nr:hypothetical protein HMPREF1400_00286 [Helicobacter pylori GAM119Bi]EMH08583.1 hypothetical protein HMPREF1409_01007 [Helicobacter pylori GAM246Ai]